MKAVVHLRRARHEMAKHFKNTLQSLIGDYTLTLETIEEDSETYFALLDPNDVEAYKKQYLEQQEEKYDSSRESIIMYVPLDVLIWIFKDLNNNSIQNMLAVDPVLFRKRKTIVDKIALQRNELMDWKQYQERHPNHNNPINALRTMELVNLFYDKNLFVVVVQFVDSDHDNFVVKPGHYINFFAPENVSTDIFTGIEFKGDEKFAVIYPTNLPKNKMENMVYKLFTIFGVKLSRIIVEKTPSLHDTLNYDHIMCSLCGSSGLPEMYQCLCGNAVYCNETCQKNDWGYHQTLCNAKLGASMTPEDLHLKILEAKANKQDYFIDEDRFIDSIDRETLLKVNDNNLRYYPTYRLLGSQKFLFVLLPAYQQAMDNLMAKRIFFNQDPKMVVDDCFKWTPVKIIGSGNEGTVVVVCDTNSCDNVAKISPYSKGKSENEASIYEKASELGLSPYFVESFQCSEMFVIVAERFDGNLFDLLLEFDKTLESPTTHKRAVNVIEQAFNIIYHLLTNAIIHRDTKVCNFLYSNDMIRIADFGIAKMQQVNDSEIPMLLEQHILLFMKSLQDPETYSCTERIENDPFGLQTGKSKWEPIFKEVLKRNQNKWGLIKIAYIS